MSNNNASSGGIGLSGALFIVFVVLRLTDHIDWEWYWVAAPLWVPLASVLVFAAIAGAVILVGNQMARSRRIKARKARDSKGVN